MRAENRARAHRGRGRRAGALADKQTPPPPGTPKAFALPAPTRASRSPNGHEGDARARSARCPRCPIVPRRADRQHRREGQRGLARGLHGRHDARGHAHPLGHADRASRRAAWAGRSTSASAMTGRRSAARCSRSSGRPWSRLVADVVRNPMFPESELARLKARPRRAALDRARASRSRSRSEKFRAVLYGDHPYGRLFPTEAMLKGYTIAQVKDFYARNFGAARSHLYVVGAIRRGRHGGAPCARRYGVEAGRRAHIHVPAPKSARAVNLLDRPDAVQSTIMRRPTRARSVEGLDRALVRTRCSAAPSARASRRTSASRRATRTRRAALRHAPHDAYWVGRRT